MSPSTPGRAVVYDEFGPVDVLHVVELAPEPPGRGEVQVAPYAVSLNAIDGKIRRGEMTLMSGRHFPKRTGQDFAGRVTAVGHGVTRWSIGDEVYGCLRGMRHGALGDSVTLAEEAVALRPVTLDPTTAAGVPMVGQAAHQALTHVTEVGPGTRVLVNGCTGGFGLYALQIARHLGADVTGVCAGPAADVARQYGAHDVVDYTTTDVTDGSETYDVILELSGHMTFSSAGRILREHGVFVDVSPSAPSLVGNTVVNPVRRQKHLFLMMKSTTESLDQLSAWFADGVLVPPPTSVHPFDEYADAYRRTEAGSVVGKVVLDLGTA